MQILWWQEEISPIWTELMERQGKESTKDGRGDKNNTPSNTYKPQWAEKFHFKGDFHRWVTADSRQISKWEIPRSAAVTVGWFPLLQTITATSSLLTNSSQPQVSQSILIPQTLIPNLVLKPQIWVLVHWGTDRWAALFCFYIHLQVRGNSKWNSQPKTAMRWLKKIKKWGVIIMGWQGRRQHLISNSRRLQESSSRESKDCGKLGFQFYERTSTGSTSAKTIF